MTAEHIAAHFPTDVKWAVAGRSAEKLQKTVDECKAINTDRIQPGSRLIHIPVVMMIIYLR